MKLDKQPSQSAKKPLSPGKPGQPKLNGKVRILVADHQPLFRDGVARLVASEPGLRVCGEAGDAAEAGQVLEREHPDLVLLDLRLGGNTDVFELIKNWKSRFPSVHILVLSGHDEPLYAERALRAGAAGYAKKEEDCQQIVKAIHTVLSGEIYLNREMAMRLLHKLIQRKVAVRDASVETLSDRELHVFRLLGLGLSSRKIGEELQLSVKTIETYRENIKHKLALRNAQELIRQATHWVENSALKDIRSHLAA